jgi:hypothetical protein
MIIKQQSHANANLRQLLAPGHPSPLESDEIAWALPASQLQLRWLRTG